MASLKQDHWQDDLIGRKKDAEFLYNFLIGQVAKRRELGQSSGYVINLDADWGGGKSFFLERFAKDIENRGHIAAVVDAWHDDYAEDPYVAIMAAIEVAFAPFVKKPSKLSTAWVKTKQSGGRIVLRTSGVIAKSALKKLAGIDAAELANVLSDNEHVTEIAEAGLDEAGNQLEKLFDTSMEDLIENFNSTKIATNNFRSRLETAIKSIPSSKQQPLFILVDELDRCRPSYAVKLLERIKHLFDVSDAVFCFCYKCRPTSAQHFRRLWHKLRRFSLPEALF